MRPDVATTYLCGFRLLSRYPIGQKGFGRLAMKPEPPARSPMLTGSSKTAAAGDASSNQMVTQDDRSDKLFRQPRDASMAANVIEQTLQDIT
jgi:hypothetical protein